MWSGASNEVGQPSTMDRDLPIKRSHLRGHTTATFGGEEKPGGDSNPSSSYLVNSTNVALNEQRNTNDGKQNTAPTAKQATSYVYAAHTAKQVSQMFTIIPGTKEVLTTPAKPACWEVCRKGDKEKTSVPTSRDTHDAGRGANSVVLFSLQNSTPNQLALRNAQDRDTLKRLCKNCQLLTSTHWVPGARQAEGMQRLSKVLGHSR